MYNTAEVPKVAANFGLTWLLRILLLFFALFGLASAQTPPSFTKVFSPDIIGPDSVSMLIFTIDNSASGAPADDLAFSDTFPADMTFAAPAIVSNDCGGMLGLSGGDTISFSSGMVGAGTTCTIVVNVTAVAADGSDTNYTNTSGDLTSDLGNSGTATDDLLVDVDLLGFSKSFAPSTVELGGRSTLTFTIDNSLNNSNEFLLSFTDVLPAGMVIASPSNAITDCDFFGLATLTAGPGTSVISLAGGSINGEESSCEVTVDVIGGAVGSLGNVSGELVYGSPTSVSSGKAAAVLEVTEIVEMLALSKEFIDDPVAPSGTVTLEFTVTNKSRADSATGITFSDDLEATLTGLAPSGPLPTDPCGASSSLGFSSGVLTLTGGSLPAEGSCTFSVELTVPSSSVSGTYPNIAGPVTGAVGGSPETGNVAGDLLFVVSFPILTKEFTDDPVGSGGTVTLEFTISNPEDGSTMSDIEFVDELTTFLPFPIMISSPTLPTAACGGTLALIFLDIERQGLELTGGSLAANDGVPGGSDTCTFSVTVDIPVGLTGGIYTNTTEEISAVLDDFPGTPTVTGPPASDDLAVVSAPTLTKEFTDDPVLPSGGTVTLELTLSYDPELPAPDATAIAFSDDLTTVVSGLIAASVDSNTCFGSTIDISTPTLIDFSGGTLTPGEICSISLTLTVPAASPVGFHTNMTSDVTASVGGVAASNNGAEDDLLITPLAFTKEFTDDPVIAGGTVTLEFTLENLSATEAVTTIAFDDNLDAALTGLEATGATTNTCGGMAISPFPTGLFSYSGGTLAPGASCMIALDVDVPVPTPDDVYANTTSVLTATIDMSSVILPSATDDLTVSSTLLELTKEFTDDPVNPGDTVTLELTLTNLSATETVTDIAFDDDLAAALTGLEATGATTNTCGGMATSAFPTGLFEYAGGSLLPGANCTITLTVDVPPAPLPGNIFTNTTTAVTGVVGMLDVFGDPASDDLEVDLLTFSKSFDGPTTATGTAVLTFTINNLDSLNAATGLAFSDDLDAALTGLVATALLPTTPCGAGSELAGTSFLTFIDGSLPAGGMCSFDVTVTVPGTASAGTFVNTSSELFSFGIPEADPATADLTIEPPPTFAKEFMPDTILAGAVSTLTFTLDNSGSALAASGLDFTDNYPAWIVVATPPNVTNNCGGTLTATAGASVIALTGGTVAAGADCIINVDVTTSTVGIYVNTTGDLTSSSGNSGAATDTLTVNAAADLSVTKTDGVTSATPGSMLTYTIVVSNNGPNDDGTVTLTDTFPAVLTCSYTSVAAGGASGNTASGSGDLAETLSLPAGSSVTYTVNCAIAADATGTLSNTATVAGSVTDPVPGNDSATDSDTVLVPLVGLAVTKTDGVISATPGESVTYAIVVTNAGPSVDPSVLLSDTFSSPPLTCTYTSAAAGGATGNTAAGSGDLAETLSMPVGSSVTYTANCGIDADATGILSNTAEITPSISDSVPGDNIATDNDTVLVPEADLSITKSDGVTSAVPSGTLTYTIVASNVGPSDDPAVTVSDSFPSELTCTYTSTAAGGATGNTVAGSGDLGETLSMPVGSSVTYTVDCMIDAAATGTLSNIATVTASVTDPDLGNNSATDNDTVLTEVGAFTFTKAFTNAPVAAGGVANLEFTIANLDPVNSVSEVAFSDDLEAVLTGLTALNTPQNDVCGTGSTLTGSSVISLSGGSLAVGATCTFNVDLQVPAEAATGTYTNTTGPISATIDVSTVTASGVSALKIGEMASGDIRVIALPILSKAFSGAAVVGGTVDLAFTITNASATLAATDISFSDDLEAVLPGLQASGLPESNICGPGSQISGTSVLMFSGGSLAPGASCQFSVTLAIPNTQAGMFTNITSPITATVDGDTVQGPAAAAATAQLEISFIIPVMGIWAMLLLMGILALLSLSVLRLRR